MLHSRFILRQLMSSRKQATVFVFCVALSIVTLVSLGGLSDSVNQVLEQDARKLQAGDIIVESNTAISSDINDIVDAELAQGNVERALVYRFISIVRLVDEDDSLLSTLKVVEPGYPFYGEVELASGRNFAAVLASGSVIVEQALLDRLQVAVGDPLRVGEATLTIADVVLTEPDRPVNFFTLGPRVFIAAADLEAIDLIKRGSVVNYKLLLKVADESEMNPLAARLEAVAEKQETVDTFQTAESGVQEFLDNFIFFLSLIGIFTLLLAGIGTQSALVAFLKEKESTIAVVKTLGSTSRFVTIHYLVVVIALGLIGTLLGLGLGLLLQSFFPILFADLLPPNVELVISPRAIVQSFLLGLFVVSAFTFLPLYRLNDLKPRFIFRKEATRSKRGWPFYGTIGLIFLFFVGLVLWQLRDITVGLYFVGGVLALILLTSGITEVTLFFLRKRRLRELAWRQALKGLFRPRNATRAIIITLATSMAVVFTIYLIEQNLDASFLRARPDNAPNVFFIDIQPDQVDDFGDVLGFETAYYPLIRADIVAINGEEIDRQAEEERRGDNLGRTFNLTYRSELLEGEEVIDGPSLFAPNFEGAQVSILDEMFEIRDFNVGDTLSFRIQGVPLDATITSIRSGDEEAFIPYFNFVLPEEILKDAPQTVFTGARVEQAEIPQIQNRIVAAFPNVSVIDVTEVLNTVADVLGKLSVIIRFFTFFSIIAGLLIIISSVFATRLARIQEAVYFKVVGATSRFVLTVFTLENLLLGFVSATLALLVSQVGSWIIITFAFRLDYQPFIIASLLMILITMFLVITVGMLASLSILRQKPIVFLREHTEE